MPSGAGHDAMVFASAGVPSLMFFVPCRGGISHSPDEHADLDAMWAGYVFLRDFVSGLDTIPERA
jgi:N-carbamoyl-L-amino-acid hydrolase